MVTSADLPTTDAAPSERARLRRKPDRARYGDEAVAAVLDAGFVCHVGLATDDGPVVIPTTYGRVDDVLYLHGSPAASFLRRAKAGAPVCVTVTHIDGLVLARSTFHHSVNYRSVVIFGTATEVRDARAKRAALDAFVEHVVPGRTAEARPPTDKELAGTLVLALPLDEASVKVRTGPPVDEPEDLALDVWAGVLPLAVVPGTPEPAPELAPDAVPSPSVTSWAP